MGTGRSSRSEYVLKRRMADVATLATAAISVAGFAVVVVDAAWLAGGFSHASLVSDLGGVAGSSLAAVACVRAARRQPTAPPRFWMLMALTMALAAAGQLLWTLQHFLGDGSLPNTPLLGVLFAGDIVCGTAALLYARSAPSSGIARARTVLDGVIVGLSLVPIGWIVVYASVTSSALDDPARALGLMYPVFDLMQLTVLIAVSGRPPVWRPLTFIAASLVVRAIADTLYIAGVADGTYVAGQLLDVAWPISYVLIALAAVYRSAGRIDTAEDASGPSPVTWWRVVLPYLLVGGAVVAMTRTRGPDGDIPPLVFLTCMALLAALAIRQGLSAYENNQLAARMRRLAYEDQLTGLPNRLLFTQWLRGVVRHGRRAAVLLLDLDGFKQINDRFGHAAGDELLQRIADRMRVAVGNDGLLARIGGDEFAVLVEHGTAGLPERLAQRMLGAVGPEADDGAGGVHTSASIGIAEYGPQHAGHADVLRDADIAMYAAKASGKSAYRICTPGLREAVVTRAELIADLRRAVDEAEQLELAFQPIVDVATGAVRGAEALVRWRHPEHGLMNPERFMPLAEESGLDAAVDQWVLHEACRAAVSWQDLRANTTVAVNLAPAHLRRADIVAAVTAATASAGLPTHALTLELTETALIDDAEIVLERLRQLRELGVQIAIDDFGTGYSSLSYLHRIPATKLKIDRSFVSRLDSPDGRAFATVQMVSRLASAFDLIVVAEGVETEAQHRAVAEIGCPQGQGYLYGRPGTLMDLCDALRNR
jgi:diguanylate cyclase